MKNLALALLAIFSLTVSVSALTPKEIEGDWESKWTSLPSPDRSMKMKQKDAYNFLPDGSFSSKSEMQLTILDQFNIDCFFYADVKGTYKIEADSVMMHIDPATIRLDFPEDEIRISGQIEPSQESMIKSTIHYNLRQMLPEIKKGIKDFTIKDVVISDEKKGKKMTCTDDGNKVEYFQKKKK